MESNDFLDNFIKLLSPVDPYEGELNPLRQLFEERLMKYKISQRQSELILGINTRALESILDNSASRVDSINVIKLCQFLGIDEKVFYKLYIKELPKDLVREIETTRKRTFIASNFDLPNLKKAKFINSISDFDAIELRINEFFGLRSIYDYSDKGYIPAFSRTKKSVANLMREFWVRSAYTQFETYNNPNPYSEQELINLLPKIKPYTRNVELGLKTVVQALYHIGVTVIYQPSLPTTQVRGATFIINEKPCIAITDLNKNYATIWFALLHELHHVLADFDAIQRQVFHMTGELEFNFALVHESEADDFARRYLFSEEKTKYIIPHIENQYIVTRFAEESQIHPCIVYSFYRYDMGKQNKGNYWARFQEFFPPVEGALKQIGDSLLFEESTAMRSAKEYINKLYNV